MIRRLRTALTVASILFVCGLTTGCGSAIKTSLTLPDKPVALVHVNKIGTPIAPFVYKPLEIDIIAAASGNQVTNAFGYDGKMIAGERGASWLPVSMMIQALQGAGMHASLKGHTLAVTVPTSIGTTAVGPFGTAFYGPNDLVISINGHITGVAPLLRTSRHEDLYVSDRDLFTALSPIHVHLHWGMQATPIDRDILYIGSPIYGIVTTTTEFDGGRGFSKQSAMTLVRPGNNWIPYGYLMNTLDNTGYGIQVNAINGFSGLDISVPRSVRVNMNHLPASSRPPAGDVPIEINGHVVAYAPSLVPNFGASSGYLASAEVMGAIKRIGIPMHWNNTDGTFTQWYVSRRPTA